MQCSFTRNEKIFYEFLIKLMKFTSNFKYFETKMSEIGLSISEFIDTE